MFTHFLPNDGCSVKRTGGQYLSELRMCPGHLPYRPGMCLPRGGTKPLSVFSNIPNLDISKIESNFESNSKAIRNA